VLVAAMVLLRPVNSERDGWTPNLINWLTRLSFFRCPMQEEPTTAVIQRYLDDLAGDPAADSAIIRGLLERAASRLHRLGANLLHRRYPRLTRPPANLETDDLLSSAVARLLTAMRRSALRVSASFSPWLLNTCGGSSMTWLDA
jgi:hypothetical protein